MLILSKLGVFWLPEWRGSGLHYSLHSLSGNYAGICRKIFVVWLSDRTSPATPAVHCNKNALAWLIRSDHLRVAEYHQITGGGCDADKSYCNGMQGVNNASTRGHTAVFFWKKKIRRYFFIKNYGQDRLSVIYCRIKKLFESSSYRSSHKLAQAVL